MLLLRRKRGLPVQVMKCGEPSELRRGPHTFLLLFDLIEGGGEVIGKIDGIIVSDNEVPFDFLPEIFFIIS